MDVKYTDVTKIEDIKAGTVGCTDIKASSSCKVMMTPDAKVVCPSPVSATRQISTTLPDCTSLLYQDLQIPVSSIVSTSTSLPTQTNPSGLLDRTSLMEQGLQKPVSGFVSTSISVPTPKDPLSLLDCTSLMDQGLQKPVSGIVSTSTPMPTQKNVSNLPDRAIPMDQGLPRPVSFIASISTSGSTSPPQQVTNMPGATLLKEQCPQAVKLEKNSSRQGSLMPFDRYHANQFRPARKRPLMVTDVDLEVDLQFFQGLLPSVDELLIRNKRRFKQAVSNLLFDMLEDQAQDCDI